MARKKCKVKGCNSQVVNKGDKYCEKCSDLILDVMVVGAGDIDEED